jgi:small-conductance mechanosensitive channel
VAMLCVLLLASVDALALAGLSDALRTAIGYLLRLFIALLIAVFGVAAAQVVRRAVVRIATESGVEFASGLGRLAFGGTLVVVGMTVISQLGIDTSNLWLLMVFLVGGITLAFGLSFGLGTRDLTRNLVAGYYTRQTFTVGSQIEFRGQRGVLRAITPTQTIIEQDGALLTVANHALWDDVVKQFPS